MAEKSGLLGAAVAVRGWLCRARARLDQAGAMANEHFASVMGASVAAGMLAASAIAGPPVTRVSNAADPTASFVAGSPASAAAPLRIQPALTGRPHMVGHSTSDQAAGSGDSSNTSVRLNGNRPGVTVNQAVPDGATEPTVAGVNLRCNDGSVVVSAGCQAVALLPSSP
jgi:hypothetical protein